MRNRAAIVFCTVLSCVVAAQPQQTRTTVISPEQIAKLPRSGSLTFHLFFLGHEIGVESMSHMIVDTFLGPQPLAEPIVTGQSEFEFRFADRGTEVATAATFRHGASDEPAALTTKGRNYRLFASDSEVEIRSGRARVRDGKAERTIELGGKPFFPIDNYAPIGIQEELIRYWIAKGRPAEIASAPSGPVRIVRRAQQAIGSATRVERLSIDGVVWGTEAAWFDVQSQQLLALTTWAGALPFAAVREGHQASFSRFAAEATADRVGDLERLTSTTAAVQRNTFALVGARIVQGTDAPPVEQGIVVVRDGRVVAVGPLASTPVPGSIATVNVAGKTIIPGLWDSHAHASQIDWAPVYLASGVTTIRDLGGDDAFLVAMRDAIRSGKAFGPRYLLAGLVDGPGPRAFGDVTAATPDEGRAVVRRYHAQGYEQMKIYSLVAPDVVSAIVDEAHKLGMTVTGHVPAGMTAQSVIEAGFDSIAHMQLRGTPDSDQSQQQIAFFKAHNTAIDPTLSWNELSGRSMAQPLDVFLPGASRLPLSLKRMFDSMSGGNGGSQVNSARLIKAAVDAGLNVMAGTDKGVPGFSLQRELEIYVQGGLTPLQAIQTASIMPARAMKLDKDLGTLEVGKFADLVVLDANPLENISNVRTARMVLTNGRLYDCNVLWKVAGFGER